MMLNSPFLINSLVKKQKNKTSFVYLIEETANKFHIKQN